MDHKEISVPLHTLDLMPENPKGQIHGVYKAGLKASLDYFGLCDRLKVVKNPKKKGRYVIINGNQRYGLIIDKFKHEILCEHFGLNHLDEYSEDPAVSKEYKSRLKAIQADPDNEKLFQNFHAKAMQRDVDVHLMDLDEDDAKLFAATFDRNRAKFDEAKIVNNIIDEVRSKNQNIISKMVRPEQAFIQPLSRSDGPMVSRASPNIAAPYKNPSDEKPGKSSEPPSDPHDFGAWGPPPTPEKQDTPKPAPMIPMTFSFSREGYKEINDRILKVSARIFRETAIKTALDQLSEALEEEPLDTDSIVVEIALLTINRHIKAFESE